MSMSVNKTRTHSITTGTIGRRLTAMKVVPVPERRVRAARAVEPRPSVGTPHLDVQVSAPFPESALSASAWSRSRRAAGAPRSFICRSASIASLGSSDHQSEERKSLLAVLSLNHFLLGVTMCRRACVPARFRESPGT
jgi:hypothetical protein